MSSHTRQQLETWLGNIDVKAKSVLDCGGSQNPIKGRTKSWEVENYQILDLEKPHQTKRKPDMIGDLNKTDYFGMHNIVFCIEVSEYWYDPFTAIYNIYGALDKNGIAYISTHFIYKLHPPEGKDYIRITPFGIEKMLKMNKLKVLEHKLRTTDSKYLDMFYEEDKMRGKTNINDNVTGSLIKCQKI